MLFEMHTLFSGGLLKNSIFRMILCSAAAYRWDNWQ
jgi:hypothetical protein